MINSSVREVLEALHQLASFMAPASEDTATARAAKVCFQVSSVVMLASATTAILAAPGAGKSEP